MTIKKLRNIYKYTIFAFLTAIAISLNTYFCWDLNWYYLIVIYAFSMTIGGFIYFFFSGVNVLSIQFIDNKDISHQYFLIKIQLGFKQHTLFGYFDNSIELNKEDLSTYIYLFVTKNMLYPTLKLGIPVDLTIPLKKSNITLHIG